MGAQSSGAPQQLGSSFTRMGKRQLKGIEEWLGQQGPGFGLNLNIDPTAADYAAQAATMRTFGGEGWNTIEDALGGLARHGGYQDVEATYQPLMRRKMDEMSAQIREQFGQFGAVNSTGAAQAIGRAGTELTQNMMVEMLGAKERAMGRQLQAAGLMGQLGATRAQALMGVGANMRGIAQGNLDRAYQDIMLRKYQMPLGLAQAALTGTGQIPYYQQAYGPSGMANMLGMMAAGASIGSAFGPWGAGIGAGAGTLLGAYDLYTSHA